MNERIAVVCGVRTPFCKAGGILSDIQADDLGAFVITELMARSTLTFDKIDEVIFGNVLQPPNAANIARIMAVKAGLSVKTPAYTVNRNCASGMEAAVSAGDKILLHRGDIYIAGGVESMSNPPICIKKKYRDFLLKLKKSKNLRQTFDTLLGFRPGFFMPEILEISDPLCGLSMGQTAELLSREFRIGRQEQDQFALQSQQRASLASKENRFASEIIPIPLPPAYSTIQTQDDGPRNNQTIESLAKLKPSFDPVNGTVTAGNSSQITDGAAALMLMRESKAKELGIVPLGYIRHHATVGLQPSRMGLGPAFAIAKLLGQTGMQLTDFDLLEINEAFAVQVLAVLRACASSDFCKKELGRDKAIGEIDMQKLNVNGGAIALGHPLGASGTRLILTLLRELRRQNKNLGLAALCIGGGQGQAVVVEVQ